VAGGNGLCIEDSDIVDGVQL